jgi:predicted  nucleic acid-binding Zn-ribbon protein
MPKALSVKPIVKNGFEIKCYRCGHIFTTVSKSLLLGYGTCGACNAVNYVKEGAKFRK